MANVFPYPAYMPSKNQTLGIVVVLLLAYVVYRVAVNKGWLKQKVDAEDTKMPEDSPVRSDWDPMPWVHRLHDAITTTTFGFTNEARCTAYKDFYEELSDAEFVDVCNAYKNKMKSTIRTDMSKTYRSGCTTLTNQWDERVLERMDRLNVIA